MCFISGPGRRVQNSNQYREEGQTFAQSHCYQISLRAPAGTHPRDAMQLPKLWLFSSCVCTLAFAFPMECEQKSLFRFLKNWIFYLFTFQMLSPFLIPPTQKPPIPSPSSYFYEGVPPPTHPLPPPCPCIPLHWGIELS